MYPSRIHSNSTYNNFPWKPLGNQSDSQRSFQESMDSGFSSSQSQSSLNAGSQKNASSQSANSQDRLSGASQGAAKVPMNKLYNMYVGKKSVSVDLNDSNSIEPTIDIYLLKEIVEKVVLLNDHVQQHSARQQKLFEEQKKASDKVEQKLSKQIDCCVDEIKVSHAMLLKKIEKLETIIDEDNRQMADLRQAIQASKYQERNCVVNHLRDTILADTQLILRTLRQSTCRSVDQINGVEGILTQSIAALKEFVGNEISSCKQLQSTQCHVRRVSPPPGGGDGVTPATRLYTVGDRRYLSLARPNQRQTPKKFTDPKRSRPSPDRNVIYSPHTRGRRWPCEKSDSPWSKFCSLSPDVEGARPTPRFRYTPRKSRDSDPGRLKRRIRLRATTPLTTPTGSRRVQRSLISPMSWVSASERSVGQLEVVEGSSSQSSPTMSMNMLSLDC